MSRWWISRVLFRVLDRFVMFLLPVFEFLHIIKWNDDVEKAVSPRGKVMWEEAIKRGIAVRSVIAFGRYLDVYVATKGKKKISWMSIPSGDGQERDAIWWMDDKSMLKKKFEPLGIPVAKGGQFVRWASMRKRFAELETPVIVKPRLGSRGRHTTTSVYTLEELREAFLIAKKLCFSVVMEEHLTGSVYRGTVVEGTVVGVLRGDPPRVTGDGVHTISELVATKNAVRDPRISAVELTPLHLDFLKRNNYTPDTVVPAGKTIDILEKIGTSYGGTSAEVTPITHPKTITYLERAAAAVDYPVIGFDFIIADVTADPDTQKWGIIEANSAPFINLHHHPIEGVPINVAAKVWDMVERKKFS